MTTGRMRWRWVQVAEFAHPDHPEWDLIQWDLEDELTLDPRRVAHPVNDPVDAWWYLRTKEAPGLRHLPGLVVLFKIVSEPVGHTPGIIEGWEAWRDEDDLVDTLMRRARNRPVV